MTDIALGSMTDVTPEPVAATKRRTLPLSHVPRLLASGPVAFLAMVPDSEVHAKLFKFALILDNLHQRALPSLWS